MDVFISDKYARIEGQTRRVQQWAAKAERAEDVRRFNHLQRYTRPSNRFCVYLSCVLR